MDEEFDNGNGKKESPAQRRSSGTSWYWDPYLRKIGLDRIPDDDLISIPVLIKNLREAGYDTMGADQLDAQKPMTRAFMRGLERAEEKDKQDRDDRRKRNWFLAIAALVIPLVIFGAQLAANSIQGPRTIYVTQVAPTPTPAPFSTPIAPSQPR